VKNLNLEALSETFLVVVNPLTYGRGQNCPPLLKRARTKKKA